MNLEDRLLLLEKKLQALGGLSLVRGGGGAPALELRMADGRVVRLAATGQGGDPLKQEAGGDYDGRGKDMRNVRSIRCKELFVSENSVHIGDVRMSFNPVTKRLAIKTGAREEFLVGIMDRLADDLTPVLGGELDGNGFGLLNLGIVSASEVITPLVTADEVATPLVNADDVQTGSLTATTGQVSELTTDQILFANGPRFGEPLVFPPSPLSGTYFDQFPMAGAMTTRALSANTVTLHPVIFPFDVTASHLGVATTVAGAAGTACRFALYDSDAAGWPNDKLSQSAAVLLDGALGYCSTAYETTFKAHRLYWVAVWTDSGATLRAAPVASAYNLGLTASDATAYATVLRRSLSYAAGNLPNPWGILAADLQAGLEPYSLRFKAA